MRTNGNANGQALSAWLRMAVLSIASLALLTSCSLFRSEVEPPPRSDEPIAIPDSQSTFTSDIRIPLRPVRRALEAEVPQQLWSIDQSDVECVAPRRTSIIGIAIKSPAVRCDLSGQVTRGRMTLSGSGQDLIVTMPIDAAITASDIGGIIKQKTASAQAIVTARVRPTIHDDWRVSADITISYDWQQEPTVKLLGREVTFADRADARLQNVVTILERTLEREFAALNIKRRITPLWQRGFATLSLNRENPPVWLRLTPKRIGFDGYTASRRSLLLKVQVDALTEIVVGEKPAAPQAQPLPNMRAENAPTPEGQTSGASAPGLKLTVPVVAQYAQLQPVLKQALDERAKLPFDVPQIGARTVEIQSVTIYGTTDNRIAVGVEFKAWPPDQPDDFAIGTVWMSALPQNEPNSRVVEFADPTYQAETSRFTTNVLLEIAKTQDFSETISGALTQNFEGDYQKLLEKVEQALARQQLGSFTVQTKFDTISTGTVMAYGEGLFLPVSAQGDAQIQYAPR